MIGDSSYNGVGRVWLSVSHNRHHVNWNYSMKIRATNEYCLSTGGSNCVETIRVR